MLKSVEQVDLLGQYQQEIRLALAIRKVEERLLDLFKDGKLFGTVHTCIGQEFVGVSVARALLPQDTLFSNHRCHGHFLAYRQDFTGLIGEVMGKEIGVCGGRGGSQHLHCGNFFSNGIQGGIVPVAAGLALAHKMKQDEGISVVFIGDGTLGEGVLYESMNIAAKWELPLLIVCENNQYAQSTHRSQTLAGSIGGRAAAFGVDVMCSSTETWLELFDEMERSVHRVRTGGKPLLHRVDTYRLMAHSKGDDDRSEEEIASYRERDPLNRLLADYGDDQRVQVMLGEIEAEIDEAVRLAEQAPYADIVAGQDGRKSVEWVAADFRRERGHESVRRGLETGLENDKRVFLFGEDIESPYGGAFKCTAKLSDAFPGRVRNTPISEAAIVGIGNGLALAGFVPVVEIMFGDFLTLAADQWINHAAKFSWMYNDQVRMPLIVRTPMGGRRGYAATHSQSIEKHFLGLPGTQVLCLHHRYSPARLYKELFETIDRPTLVIENKILYGRYVESAPPAGFCLRHTQDSFPMVNLHPALPADLTLIAMGGVSLEAEQAVMALFEKEEIVVDLFLPTCLFPFELDALLPSLAQTGRLLVVEEGQGFVSLSSEILAQVAERTGTGVQCARLNAFPAPIPASRPLESRFLPDADDIVRRAMELVRG